MDANILAARFRAAVEDVGLLLIHDQELPSATAIAAGGPFGGSWWSHPLAHPIYDALQLIDEDLTRAKLVKGKVTLIAPRLWGPLAAVGASRAEWQLDGLPPDAADLLASMDDGDAPRRAPPGSGKDVLFLERRLLVHTDQVHTDAGRHAKVLAPWPVWAGARSLAWEGIDPGAAMAAFEGAASGWPPVKGRLFAWPP